MPKLVVATIWRLEWPNGQGAYVGGDHYKLLPPCYQHIHVDADKHHPMAWPWGQPHDTVIHNKNLLELAEAENWHFGFASKHAFDLWFTKRALAFVNSPQCANGLLVTACYTVPIHRAVICLSHQAVFDPKAAKRLSQCPCGSGTPAQT